MHSALLFAPLTFGLLFAHLQANGQVNYLDYHNGIARCEQLIAASKFGEATDSLEVLFKRFDFVFLKDCQVAATLSAYAKDLPSTIRFVRLGILQGWTLKDIQKNEQIRELNKDSNWENLVSEYDSLHSIYLERLNAELSAQVHDMYKKDQKKAIASLFRIGHKAKTRYAEKIFAPHSERQIDQLNTILDEHGYPGEQLIGNNWWTSVILSHHNSMSEAYNSKDTLYPNLRPKLMEAFTRGEVSPHELMNIEDWRTAALSGHGMTTYGLLGAIHNDSLLQVVNNNRAELGMRSIALRNELIDIELATGMDLQLPKGWQRGKIRVNE